MRRVACFRGIRGLVVGSAVDVTESVAGGCSVTLGDTVQHVVGLYGGYITSAIDVGVAVGLPAVASRIGENTAIEGRTLRKMCQKHHRQQTYRKDLPEVGCLPESKQLLRR